MENSINGGMELSKSVDLEKGAETKPAEFVDLEKGLGINVCEKTQEDISTAILPYISAAS
uniref:Uncharacterized protein n=1 Tax=Oryza punctata TaxID=4537 RepID=A0A0E0JIL3_ORYPU